MAIRLRGLQGMGRLARRRRGQQQPTRGSQTGTLDSRAVAADPMGFAKAQEGALAQERAHPGSVDPNLLKGSPTGKAMATSKAIPEQQPGSQTAVRVGHQQAQAGVSRPATLQQSQAMNSELAQSATAADTRDFTSQVDSLVQGMGKPGMFNMAQKKAQQNFQNAVNKAKEGGISYAELQSLQSGFQGQPKGFQKGAQAFQTNTGGALNKLITEAGAAPGTPAGAGEQGNPFAEGTVAEQYRPQIGKIGEQAMTQADQQAASEQAQKDYASGINTDVQGTQDRTGANIEKMQGENTAMHDQFTQERKAMSEDLQNMPDRIKGTYDAALDDFTQRVNASQGVIDTKEAAALSNIQKGQSQAMAAAVQGTQGNVNNQIAQINANPNLTDSQKAQMSAQVRMAGAASMGPQVGQTVLQFNQLSAQTAVAFGQMTTQIQDTGLKGAEDLLAKGAAAYENTNIAAKQIGAQLLSTQAQADNNYITSQHNMEATRAQIDMTGDTLRASLIPEMGIPYPDYANVMAQTLKMDVDLMNRDFQNTLGRDTMAFQMSQAVQQGKGGVFQTMAQIFSGIGGPLGQIGMGLSMLGGNMAAGNVQTPTSMTGGYSQAAGSGSYF